MTSPHAVEIILSTGLRRLLQWGVPLTLVALLFRSPEPDQGLMTYTLVHLSILQVATFLYVIEVAPLTDEPWFPSLGRSWLASTASAIAAGVGFSALLTIATSAAARYDVSLQFLQLLSSLDIAWVVAAIYVGGRFQWGESIGRVLGSVLLVACVASIAVYLAVVGFDADGGWLVDGGEMMRIVIPSDVMAAAISLTILFRAASQAIHKTAQPSAQS